MMESFKLAEQGGKKTLPPSKTKSELKMLISVFAVSATGLWLIILIWWKAFVFFLSLIKLNGSLL